MAVYLKATFWLALLLFSSTAIAQTGLRDPSFLAKLSPSTPTAPPPPSTEWVTVGPSSAGILLTAGGGVKFTVGASDITVTHLGRWVRSGNSQTHNLALNNSGCTTIATATVDCNGATPDTFIYAACTPVTLTAGQVYYLMSAEDAGGDTFSDEGSVTVTSVATVTTSAFGTPTFTTCNSGNGGVMYVGVSFKYTIP